MEHLHASDHKYQPESCARCGQLFVCNANNISNCDCMKVTISENEQKFISARFLNCLCNQCLKELKYEYYLAQAHNKTNE